MLYESLDTILEEESPKNYKAGKGKLKNLSRQYQQLQLEKSRMNRFIRDVHYSGASERKKALNVTKKQARSRVGEIKSQLKEIQAQVENIIGDSRELRKSWTAMKTEITTNIEKVESEALAAKNPSKAEGMKRKNRSDKIRSASLKKEDKENEKEIVGKGKPKKEISPEKKAAVREKLKSISSEIKKIKEKKKGTSKENVGNQALNRRQGRLQREQRKLKSIL